jgi:hypothetical protein
MRNKDFSPQIQNLLVSGTQCAWKITPFKQGSVLSINNFNQVHQVLLVDMRHPFLCELYEKNTMNLLLELRTHQRIFIIKIHDLHACT